jgi:type II secretory pathway pseudopilin PulG
MPKVLKWILIGAAVVVVCGVVLIAVGAAIAIPSMQKFQSKARQSEAKLNLSLAFNTLQMAHVENDLYSDDAKFALEQIAPCPDKSGCLNYLYAIRRSCSNDNSNEPFAISQENLPKLREHPARLIEKAKRTLFGLPIPCKANDKGFTLVAVGFPDDNNESVDVWSVDEHRVLQSHSTQSSTQ